VSHPKLGNRQIGVNKGFQQNTCFTNSLFLCDTLPLPKNLCQHGFGAKNGTGNNEKVCENALQHFYEVFVLGFC
jgi:hypothetical protein